MAYVPNSGSVVAFQSNASALQASVTGTVAVTGSVITVLPITQNISGSVVSHQGTNPWVITGSVQGSFSPAANQSVSGTIHVDNFSSVIAYQLAGSILATSATVNPAANQSVSGTVQTDVRGSVATVIIGGSIAASFTPPANQSVSGTVIANQGTSPWIITGSVQGAFTTTNSSVQVLNFPTTQNISGSVVASGTVNVGNFPANQSVSGAISVSNFPTTQNVSGSVAAFVQGTPNVNVAGSVAAWLQSTNASIITVGTAMANQSVSGTVNVGNLPTTQNVSGSVVTFQAGTRITSVSGIVNVGGQNSDGSVLSFNTAPDGDQIVHQHSSVTTLADGVSNVMYIPINQTDLGFMATPTAGYQYNGTSWDRTRGDATNGLLVNLGANNDVTGSVVAIQGAGWSGSVAAVVTNFPSNQSVSGAVSVSNLPANQSVSGAVSVSNFPTTQNVSGSVVAVQGTNPWIVTGSVQTTTGNSSVQVLNFPSNTSVSGAISVSNFPSNQSVSGTINTTQAGTVAASISGQVIVVSSISGGIFPVSGSVAATITNTNLNVGGSVVAFQGAGWSGSVAATVTNFPTTQNVSGSVVASGTVTANQGTGFGSIATHIKSGSVIAVLGGNTSVIALQNGAWYVSVMSERSATPTLSSVQSSISTVTLLAANPDRKGATIFNSAGTTVFTTLGTSATTSVYTVAMFPNDYYEVPFGYTGDIAGITASNAGLVSITELT